MSMKHYIFVILVLFCIGNAMECMGRCETCGKRKPDKTNVINDYPAVITKPGRYKFESDIVLSHKDTNDAAIIIKADNVTIDMAGHTLDMKSCGRTGILVGPYKNIRIFNGKVVHTGNPGKIQNSESPFASEPLRGIGLALKPGGENIYIEKIVFEENFIGIGCLDKVKHLSIISCSGIECGLKQSNHRGGFIVIAPTQAHSETVFENIKISQCEAHSQSAQYGIAVFNAKNLLVDACTIHHPSTTSPGAITASGCQHVNFTNLTAHGGADCISTVNCTDANISNCYSIE